jgi:hypothetical protein
MSVSDSRSGAKERLRGSADSSQPNLSSLRAQFTSTPSPSLDQTMMRSSRFRDEERLRAGLRRDKKIRRQALTERISVMQDNMAVDLSRHHDMTIGALERDLRSQMEQELSHLESETLTREELRLKEMHELRLTRELESLKESLEIEQGRKMEQHRIAVISRLEGQLSQEHGQRLAFARERMELEFNHALQRRIRDLESTIQNEMEQRFTEMEQKEVSRLEEGQTQKLAEREEALRRGIRTRLEQQLKLRLKQREASMRAEYERRSLRLEEDIAASIQDELESRLRSETEELEERMRQDVELAVARKREVLRVEIEKQLESTHSEKLADRKGRLREKYDLTFSKAVDDISRSLETEIESELEARTDQDFASYRNAREAEIQNRLARFRYEREAELRDQLSDRYESKKEDWSERLELEFSARESAARKAIMSEIDGRLRNERITHETDLDLLKEETVLELEVEMEDRLADFRSRKEDEVATQLERQLDKREEIMRNKALIEVRKREANIRAEIEAQLGVKRSEIRDRLSMLTQQMDDFRSMAETKMRESIEGKVQGDITADEARLREQEEEYTQLQSTDSRVDKRSTWLQAISGQGTQAQAPQIGMDPSSLGARPDALGASAGRPIRGALAQAASQHTPSIGLGGMRAPRSAATSLSGALPMPKPIKAPIGSGLNQPIQGGVALPQPVSQKIIRQPLPQSGLVKPVAPALTPIPLPTVEERVSPEPENISEPEPEAVVEVEAEVEDIAELMESAFDEVMDDELDQAVLMTPIQSLKVVGGQLSDGTASLTPVETKVLTPAKRRGPPPSSAPGSKPGEMVVGEEQKVATLTPVSRLTPLKTSIKTLGVKESSEEE